MGQADRRTELVRHEEELIAGTVPIEAGRVRLRKRVEVEPTAEIVQVHMEHAEIERVAADSDDSGKVETLPDGSISIPVLEEELVVTRRTVVRERIVVRKRLEVEEHRIAQDLRREEVDVEVVKPEAEASDGSP